ncbi:MAG: hypothetical protein HZB26_10815 [Candidatus Hydrogenedentes bacterium]|nr:hypothetical protein [Candidatus Hydrogenedentota bacterium]
MLDALREDARRQVVEKAVGTFVDSSTLVENYVLVRDRVLTKSKGLIKQVIKESDPWEGKDGFMHILLKAEVYITKIGDALKEMSKTERVSLIREYGNPKISVAIVARDADRASTTAKERSPIAENVLIEQLTKFGYRVWSEDENATLKAEVSAKEKPGNAVETNISVSQPKAADFSIVGEAKFKKLSAKLPPSNIEITKYVLTSLSVKCVNNHTGEIILSKNEVPKNKSWADEDVAVEEIGKIVGQDFTKEFFEEHLMEPSKIYQLKVAGLPDYDTGTQFKKEMIGLRPVLNVDFRDFSADGVSNYEVTFAGARGNFTDLVNDTVIKPLNAKFGGSYFKLSSAQGEVVSVQFACDKNPKEVLSRFDTAAPAALAQASPERLKELVKDEATMKKVAEVNPDAVKKLADTGNAAAGTTLKSVKDF